MNFISKMAERFMKFHRKMRRWRRLVTVLAAVVVFVTTYSLILPAITMDVDTASGQAGIVRAGSEAQPSSEGSKNEEKGDGGESSNSAGSLDAEKADDSSEAKDDQDDEQKADSVLASDEDSDETVPADGDSVEETEGASDETADEEGAEENALVYPENTKTFHAYVSGYNIAVEVPANSFSEEVTLEAEEQDWADLDRDVQKKLEDEGVSEETSQSLDIRFENADGEETEPANKVSVRITISDENALENASEEDAVLDVYHAQEKKNEDGEVTGIVVKQVASTEDDSVVLQGETKAVAEFETFNFSTFTITWRISIANLTVPKAVYTIHYVDTNGDEIDDPEKQDETIDNLTPVVFAEHSALEGYEFQEARLNGADGEVVTKVDFNVELDTGGLLDCSYYNGDTKVEDVNVTLLSNEYTTGDIYFVYKKVLKSDGVKLTFGADAGLDNASLNVSKVAATRDYIDAIRSAVETADIEVNDFRFYDIDLGGAEPNEGSVVTTTIILDSPFTLSNRSGIKVVHFNSNGQVEVIDPISDTTGTVSSVTFEASSFSVYGVVETGTTSNVARTTYNFYTDTNTSADGQPYNTQIVKKGDELVEPETPTKEGAIFVGWYSDEALTTEFTGFGTILENQTEGTTVSVYAKFEEAWNITFYDESGNVITTKQVAKDSTSALDISDVEAEKATDSDGTEYALVGWSTTKGATTAEYTTSISSVSRDMNLYPVYASAHVITFDANDGGDGSATTTASQRYTISQTTSEPSKPERQGYTFGGWYTDAEGENAFIWGNTLENNITLYAKWIPKETTYTVVVWKQQVGDDKDATDAEKTYDYAESYTVTAYTGDEISASSFSSSTVSSHLTGDYTGFKYGSAGVTRTDSTSTVTVAGDGSSIINVYYDRELITMTFKSDPTYTYSSTNASYDQQSVQYGRSGNSWSGYTYFRIYYLRATSGNYYWWYEDGNSYSRYTGTRYTRSATYGTTTTYTGLYGQPLSKYNYSWPSGTWQYTASNGTTYGMSYLGQFVLPEGAAAGGASFSTSIEFVTTGDAGFTVYFFLQNTDGSWPTTYSDRGYLTSGGTFYFSEKYDNFNVYQYQLDNGGNGTTGNWSTASTDENSSDSSVSLSDSSSLGIRYARKSYNVEFYNGSTHLDADQTYYYEASISGITTPTGFTYPGNSSDASHYVFVGWFADPELTTYVSFGTALSAEEQAALQERYPSITSFVTYSTMPGHNLPVYAGWKPVRLTVEVDVNDGTLPDNTGITTWTNDQHTAFTVDYGDYIPTTILGATRTGYELMGWYVQNEDGTLGDAWIFGSPVTSDITLVAKWRSTSTIKIAYDATSSDNLVGSNAPTDSDTYLDQSEAVVEAACTAPEGYYFVGWVLDDTTYYPGETFNVDIADAVKNENGEYVITLKARYDKIDKTSIIFHANGTDAYPASVSPSDTGDTTKYTLSDLALNATVDLSDVKPTRGGYVLVGWSTDSSTTYSDFDAKTAENFNTTDKIFGDNGGGANELTSSTIPNDVYAVWAPIYVEVSLTKTGQQLSGDPEALAGATFSLSNGTESATKTATSDSNGSVSFTGSNSIQVPAGENGTITLKETAAPTNYLLDETEYTVTYSTANPTKREDGTYYVTGTVTDKDGKTVTSIENKLNSQNLIIKKVDSTDSTKTLSGAEFTLTTTGSTPINATATSGITNGKVTVGNDGTATITGLPVGTYTLTETKAPDGYIITGDGTTIIEVTSDSVIVGSKSMTKSEDGSYIVTIENKAGEALPNTGGSGTLLYTLGGIMLIALAGLMYGLVLRRNNGERRFN